MQPQKKAKKIPSVNDYSFVTSYKKAIYKLAVHFNNSENTLPWYIHRSTLESVSIDVCCHLCNSAAAIAVPQCCLQLNGVQR